ncbi:prepilin-type N-terminal cleavage/methylation domain-containing protein [Maribacter polysiphoniae]|uniref:Prepilin-type N-terminal cleavage/methylation domain-containing protein n=1 Tax=Maribacter polysiphoniae TaxID=429344 RepID=A0A316DVA3_9FLAO|nr:prepilin-type N-terminal cleavage/methylation domain-containing protein [Maribacter polysiphoniae]MBD1261981.1 prepilin-type N-terminal cleavage/methylation domain-containing protein [Maribacter polysiphoniae]PWK21666.1 prepilin-type N-terminal cleavage/methylation domain-containing protein [Maribacter polysiphoniae]
MRNRVRKIKAFTLSEMIVVLLITTIVVGMAYSVLNLVQKQMNGIERNYEKKTDLNLLRQSLWIDFNRYDRVFYSAKSGELSFVNELGAMNYTVSGNLIIKEKDTFNINWEVQKFLFENKERSFGEIDAIYFETTKEFGSQPLFVNKTNSATTYMNQ